MLVFIQLQNDLQWCKRRSDVMWPCLQETCVCCVWNMWNDDTIYQRPRAWLHPQEQQRLNFMSWSKSCADWSFRFIFFDVESLLWLNDIFFLNLPHLYLACQEIHTLLCDRHRRGGWVGVIRGKWWRACVIKSGALFCVTLMAEWHRDVVMVMDETLWGGLKPRSLTPEEVSLLLWEQFVIIWGSLHLI